jgi:hypothetical protein
MDIKNSTLEQLSRLFDFGFISYSTLKEELDRRGIKINIDGSFKLPFLPPDKLSENDRENS